MPNPLYTYILNIYDLPFWGFMAYQKMPNPLYTYILNIYDLTFWGFMAYQTLKVI